MTYVQCSCGVSLLYLTTNDGPVEHWSKANMKGCPEIQTHGLNQSGTKCLRITRLVLGDFAARRIALARLRGPLKSGTAANGRMSE